MNPKAHHILKKNIDALLRARHLKRKDLALWCRRSEGWLSQIFTDEDRNMPLKYLDRIADFFRLETYQLFQPGLIPETDRRRFGYERRSGNDRRATAAGHVLQETPSMAALEARMRQLTPDAYRRFARRVEAALTLAEPPGDGAGSSDRKEKEHQPPPPPPPRSRRNRTAPK